jgi:hypothetical protein
MSKRSGTRSYVSAIPGDLVFVAVLGLWTTATALGLFSTEVGRVLLGALAVLFAPGYALVAALFPGRSTGPSVFSRLESGVELESRTVTPLERVVLAVGLSLCMVPLIGVGLHYTSGGINPASFLGTIGSMTTLLAVVAGIRRYRVSPVNRFNPRLLRTPLTAASRLETGSAGSVMSILLILGFVIAGSGIGIAMLGADPGEQFTEFYLTTDDPETGEAKPFEDGAEGELIYTHLRREATPLVRFRSGDYVRVVGTDCDCGRTAPKMQCIGRADDMLIYKGMNVFPSAIRDVVSEVDGVAPRLRVIVPEGQVHFEEPIPIEIAIEPGSDRSDAEVVEDVVQAVRDRLKARVAPTVVPIDDLPPGEYKTKLIEHREE